MPSRSRSPRRWSSSRTHSRRRRRSWAPRSRDASRSCRTRRRRRPTATGSTTSSSAPRATRSPTAAPSTVASSSSKARSSRSRSRSAPRSPRRSASGRRFPRRSPSTRRRPPTSTFSPSFNPVTDIDPATVVVNGVAFPNATIRTDPVDENNDGIPDAIITITPRSNLGLSSTTTTLTISSRTLVTSPNNANKSWSGTAAIIVTGAPGPVPTPTPGPGLVLPIGTFVPTSFVPPFGPDHLVPPPSVLSRLDYKAIPLHVAQNQYLPTPGFGVRTFDYFHPGAKHPRNGAATGFAFQKRRIKTTLAPSIYTPSKFPTGKTVAFTHKVRVIPTSRQREVYRPTPLKHPTNRS